MDGTLSNSVINTGTGQYSSSVPPRADLAVVSLSHGLPQRKGDQFKASKKEKSLSPTTLLSIAVGTLLPIGILSAIVFKNLKNKNAKKMVVTQQKSNRTYHVTPRVSDPIDLKETEAVSPKKEALNPGAHQSEKNIQSEILELQKREQRNSLLESLTLAKHFGIFPDLVKYPLALGYLVNEPGLITGLSKTLPLFFQSLSHRLAIPIVLNPVSGCQQVPITLMAEGIVHYIGKFFNETFKGSRPMLSGGLTFVSAMPVIIGVAMTTMPFTNPILGHIGQKITDAYESTLKFLGFKTEKPLIDEQYKIARTKIKAWIPKALHW